MTMGLLDSAPSSFLVGQGLCLDDQGSAAYSSLFCRDCPASLSPDTCAISCWDIQQTHIDPLELDLEMVGYMWEDDYCECLVDTKNGAAMNEYSPPLDEIAAQTNSSFSSGGLNDMGPITSNCSSSSSAWCYSYDIVDTNQTEITSPPDNTDNSTCVDQEDFLDNSGDGCEWYSHKSESRCNDCHFYTNSDGRNACGACCVCGGGGVNREDNQPSNYDVPGATWEDSSSGGRGLAVGGYLTAITFVGALLFVTQHCKSRVGAQYASTQRQRSLLSSPQTSEPTEDQRMSDFEAKLAPTTMVVSKKDLIPKNPALHTISSCGGDGDQDSGDTATIVSATSEEAGEEGDIVVVPYIMDDIELGIDDNIGQPTVNKKVEESIRSDAEQNWVLQLPATNDSQQHRKEVSCVCAICLSTYKADEAVSWAARVENETTQGSASSSSSCGGCPHAFHTSCIVKYAMTSTSGENSTEVVPCPLCRQLFVETN
mmetsp:Transcript_8129/g.17199  ORF Transcript_8129/g.17199 Transcript_8129/m.17199 type:complete len:484 (+) Transcript_8129:194-1645(+)